MIDRVTWDDLYPRAVVDDEPLQGIVQGSEEEPCYRCGALTTWVSFHWEKAVCSFICDDLGWVEYGNDVWGVGWADQGEEPFK